MTQDSNVDQVNAWLKEVVGGFDFETQVEDGTLGEDLAGIVADGISVRSIDQSKGADSPWPANEEQYKAWKLRKYNVDVPNVRTGQMLSIESLIGGTTVRSHNVEMLYGTGNPPSRSSASSYFDPDTDGSISDIEKAYFCSQSRPFYELDDTIAEHVFERAEDALVDYLREAAT